MRDYRAHRMMWRASGTTQNECVMAFEQQSHLSCRTRKHKSTLSLYPCAQVCLIIRRDRHVLKSPPQSASIWSFLCVLINLFCSPGVSECREMWKPVRDNYRPKAWLLKKSNPGSLKSSPLWLTLQHKGCNIGEDAKD